MLKTNLYVLLLVSLTLLVGCGNDTRRGPEDAPSSAGTHDSLGRGDLVRRFDSVPEAKRKYDVKSGIVEYRNSDGDVVQTLYFDGYGTQEALYTVPGPGHDSTGWPFNALIHADSVRYGYNPGAPFGRKSRIETGIDALLGTVPYVSGDPKGVAGARGLKVIGEKEIVGMKATGYRYTAYGERITVWAWKRIPLSITVSWGDDPDAPPQTVEATSIRTDVEVPLDKLTVPPDVNFQDPT